VLQIAANSYACWSIVLPSGAKDVEEESWFDSTACQYYLVILPPPLFEQFQNDRTGLPIGPQSSGAPCSPPPVAEPIGIGWPIPLNISSGDTLLFYNPNPAAVALTTSYPVEISYTIDP